MDHLAVRADEPFIAQHPGLAPRGLHHLSRQRPKVVEFTRVDCQLDLPRHLLAHVTHPSCLTLIGKPRLCGGTHNGLTSMAVAGLATPVRPCDSHGWRDADGGEPLPAAHRSGQVWSTIDPGALSIAGLLVSYQPAAH